MDSIVSVQLDTKRGLTTTANSSVEKTECPCQRIPLCRRGSSGASMGIAATKTTSGCSSPFPKSTSSSTFCSFCVVAYLQEARQRRERVLKEHQRLREECRQTLESSPPWSKLQHELMDLHRKTEKLRATSNQLALVTAKLACQNEERKALLEQDPVVQQREWLQRWKTCLLLDDGALTIGLKTARQQVRRVRFQWAMAAFTMHRLDVPHVQRMSSRMKHARGIGKIGGLPLPHAGSELYAVLPPTELQSALRLVASVTSLVASCLGIRLPHPILLKSQYGPFGDLTSLASPPPAPAVMGPYASPSTHHQGVGKPIENPNSLSSSTLSLASYVGQTANKFLARNSTNAPLDAFQLQQQQNMHFPPLSLLDTTEAVQQQRIHHARCAVLAENDTGSQNVAKYSLSVTAMQQKEGDEFTIALQLLQNDIVALCIRAGAPVAQLWPAEAVLLNLQVLNEFCMEQARGMKELITE